MGTKRFLWLGVVVALAGVNNDSAAQTTNSWTNNVSSKWEIGSNWSLGAPPTSDTLTFITNGSTKTVTIDATTVLSNGLNGCMTISNLSMLSFGGGMTTLQLTNAGAATPLRILNACDIHAGVNILVTNSTIRVEGGPFDILNSLTSANLTVQNGGKVAMVGPLTVTPSAPAAGRIFVDGGLLVVTNNPALVGAGSGFVIDGGVTLNTGSSIVVSNTSAIIGSRGSGSLTVSGGSLSLSGLTVGSFGGSQGTLTLVDSTNIIRGLVSIASAGAGSVWHTGGQLVTTNASTIIGNGGVGQLTLSNAAWLATNVTVGLTSGSQGTLTMAGGTTVLTSGLTMGSSNNAAGTLWMTAGQLLMTNVDTLVGHFGVGQMTVSNGTVQARDVYVGNSAGSLGTLTVTGGTIMARSGFVGNLGGSQGLYTVAGGTNNWVLLSIAAGANATGITWVTGGQLIVTNSGITVGQTGAGQMTVSNGVVLTLGLAVGRNAGSQGTLTIAGGTNTLSSALEIGFLGSASGTVWMTGGQLVVTNGATRIGDLGIGQMTMSNGTLLAGDVAVGVQAGSHGAWTLAGGTNTALNSLVIGNCAVGVIGLVTVSGAQLFVTNAAHNATLDVRSGTFTINSGTVVIDNLVMTNDCGRFVRTGGTLSITSTNLDANLDADGDGIPNGYEQSHGLDPLNAADASIDTDGDGLSNLQEFQAGTDPTNSASFFGITSIAREGTDIRVTWMMGSSKTNALERTAGDSSGSFTNNFATIFIVTKTVGTTTNYLDIGAATNVPALYYRVRLVP